MKGRKPKSSVLKLLHGNPSKRPVPAGGEPFMQGEIDKPAGLDPLASEEWDRLALHLAPILCPASRGMMLVCVSAFSQLMSADSVIQEKGLTYETTGKAGSIFRIRPEVRIRDAARTAYHRALAELGASPVAHSRVHKLPKDQQTEIPGIDRFFT